MRLAFMGTPLFSVPPLKALIDAGHDIACVYTKPAKPVGRGHSVQKTPVHAFAEEHGIPVMTPTTLRDPEVQAQFKALNLDACVVVSYGLILPKEILETPRLGCFNIHASLLPRWRGAAPIHRAVQAGDTETGVTIMQMDVGLDTGPMLYKVTTPITSKSTTVSLFEELSNLGAEAMVYVLENLDTLTPEQQPEEGVTYAERTQKDEGRVDWTQPAEVIERMIRAFSPWPGVTFKHGDLLIKAREAKIVNTPSIHAPGTVVDHELTVQCGKGALRLTKLQRPNKAPMEASEFLRGYVITKGDVLS